MRARPVVWGAGALVAGLGVVGALLAAAGDDEPRRTATTLGAVAGPARPGEQVHVSGRVRVDGGSADDLPVRVQGRATATAAWRTLAATDTTDGRWGAWVTVTDGADVRAVVPSTDETTGSVSSAVGARVEPGARDLPARAALVGRSLGADADDPDTGGDVLAVDVRERGAVVGTRSGAWVVHGRLWDGYEAAGGPRGRLGVPLADAVCGLPGGGCVQRFANGAVYHAPGAPEPLRVTSGDPDVAAFEAVARAQVGYVEPSWRGSRWNTWIGNDNAWCGIFQSWVSGASGNDAAVPLERSFEDLVASTSRDTTRLSDRPVIGSLAFMDLEDAGHPTHVGLVTGADGDRVHLVEGNVGPEDGRAVVEMTREAPPVDYYWLPRY